MAVEYFHAPEIEKIVQEYLKFHPDLIGANIACILKEKASKKDGVPIVGKIGKVSPKWQPLMTEPFDYVIEIGSDAWVELSPKKQEAWIDHLLEHAYGEENDQTGEMSWKLRTPELQVFPTIIQRHGIDWQQGLGKIANLPLPSEVTATAPKTRDEDEDDDDLSDLL